MSLGKLDVLKEHQQALLLAEVGALLHDMGKCADEHIVHQASDMPSGHSYRYKTAQSHLLPSTFTPVTLLGESVTVQDLIEKSRPRIISDMSKPWLLRVLGKCHAVAHVEKELADSDTATKQPKDDTRLSTAYGSEGNAVNGLTRLLHALPFHTLADRSTFLPQVKQTFNHALGDTRRPVNEVTLADWSDVVAALYKSSLASALLGLQPDPDHLRWRLLRVNFDALGLYAKAIKIADLLGYQHIVDKACEQVKQLIEEEYPLGNEVYRDTTGIYFTFPDLDLLIELYQEIRRRVEEVNLELAPRIGITVGDGETATKQLKGILAKARNEARQVLAQPFDNQNLSPCWQHQWEVVGEGKWEVCPVCRLRPMHEGEEACEHCKERRGSRIEAWQKAPHRTIWMNELADHNDRVALIVGKFGLDDWLSGDLVQTMLVKADPKTNTFTPKNPSPARLRRVWETCRRFWTETVEKEILAKHEYAKNTKRADLRLVRRLIVLDKKDGWKENMAYNGIINGKPIDLLWRKELGRFITIINLQLTGDIEVDQKVTVSDPDDPRKKITFTVQAVEQPEERIKRYTPFLPLPASPDQFLALVPAADALEIAEQIRKEYENQFGKVQNRLPLFLGLVFFHRKMPLMAVMDAARRMLGVSLKEEQWSVECCRRDDKGLNQYVRLSQGGQRVTLNVPIKMGDNNTDDIWYPYFFVERFADGTPGNREYRFQLNGRWLVHVNDLKKDDVVAITPSRFAYLWLEHIAKRFEFDPVKHLLLLEELPRLKQMWNALRGSGITDTALHNVQALLKAKGAAWGSDSNEFEHLTHTVLKDAGLFQHKDPDGNPLPDAVIPQDVISGRFARCLELYLHILKQKIKKED